MIRGQPTVYLEYACIPRESGDDPHHRGQSRAVGVYSPRERG